MTQATHTPGPWINRSDYGLSREWICDNQGKHFLHIRAVREPLKYEFIANMLLIAAAPDMLEALCMAQGLLVELRAHELTDADDVATLAAIEAAIAKAVQS